MGDKSTSDLEVWNNLLVDDPTLRNTVVQIENSVGCTTSRSMRARIARLVRHYAEWRSANTGQVAPQKLVISNSLADTILAWNVGDGETLRQALVRVFAEKAISQPKIKRDGDEKVLVLNASGVTRLLCRAGHVANTHSEGIIEKTVEAFLSGKNRPDDGAGLKILWAALAKLRDEITPAEARLEKDSKPNLLRELHLLQARLLVSLGWQLVDVDGEVWWKHVDDSAGTLRQHEKALARAMKRQSGMDEQAIFDAHPHDKVE